MRRADINLDNVDEVYKRFAGARPNTLARNLLFPAIGILKHSKVGVSFMNNSEEKIRDYSGNMGKLYIANHARESDAVGLVAAFRRAGLTNILNNTVTLAKAPLFNHPILGPLVEAFGAIPVFRTKDEADQSGEEREVERQKMRTKLTQICTSRLLAEANVAYFPQGTTEDKVKVPDDKKPLEVLRFKPGVAFLALDEQVRNNLEIVPMGIDYARDQRMHLTFGESFTPLALIGTAENNEATRQAFLAEAEQRVQDCIDYQSTYKLE